MYDCEEETDYEVIDIFSDKDSNNVSKLYLEVKPGQTKVTD